MQNQRLYLDNLDRVCGNCSTNYTVGKDTLILGPCGPEEVCPGCGKKIRVLGDFAETAMGLMH